MGFCAAEQIIRIRRCVTEIKTGKQTEETQLAISSIRPVDDIPTNARILQDVVRGHWTIENGNHYVRDRTYDEDRCQVRNANRAEILATLRCLARWMAQRGFHKPRNNYEKTTPAFIRHCQAHRGQAIGWLVK